MTLPQAGWYPDPGAPASGIRYWDGERWTEHVGHPAGRATPTTSDGVPLAGWWERVGAYVVDGFVVGVGTALIGLPLLIRIVHAGIDYVHRVVNTPDGATSPGTLDLYRGHWSLFLGWAALAIAIQLVYFAGMLRFRGATLGMTALGIGVRRRDVPGPMPWSTVLLRWVGQFGYTVVAWVPFGGVVGWYGLLDDLWPLWDGRRQALHDKLAGTVVVRVRS